MLFRSLTAPKSGKETRQDIQQAAVKARSEAEHHLKSMHSELDKLIAQGKGQVDKAQTGAKKQFDTAMTAAQNAKDKAREMLSAIHEGGAEDKDLQKAIDEVHKAVADLKKFVSSDKKSE